MMWVIVRVCVGCSVKESFVAAQGRVRADPTVKPGEHDKFVLLRNEAATMFYTPEQGAHLPVRMQLVLFVMHHACSV